MKKITLILILLSVSFGYSQDPATGPSDPLARDAGDVVSFYNGIDSPTGDEYTNITGVGFDTFSGTTIIGNVTLADGNIVHKYTNHNYHGIGGGSYDVSEMEMLHIDFYSPDNAPLKIKIELNDGGGVSGELDVPAGPPTPGQWNSYDIDLSTYNTLDFSKSLKWIIPVTQNNITMYLDNIYFYRTPVDPTINTTLSDLQVDNVTIPDFSSDKLDYIYGYAPGTVDIPQITLVTTTNVNATVTTITQASSIPGDATVLVTAEDGSTTATYTISFVEIVPPCEGSSTEAREGVFTNGYNYTIETLSGGTEVKYTIELLDNFGGVGPGAQLHAIEPDVYINMTNTGLIFEGTVTGLTNGEVIAFAGRFPYEAGGLVETKLLEYEVGGDCVTLGTKDFKIVGLNLYPNPTKDSWNVKTKNINITSINVYDVLGKNVISISPNSREATIDGTSLKRGMYFAQIKTAKGLKSIKIIKQ